MNVSLRVLDNEKILLTKLCTDSSHWNDDLTDPLRSRNFNSMRLGAQRKNRLRSFQKQSFLKDKQHHLSFWENNWNKKQTSEEK